MGRSAVSLDLGSSGIRAALFTPGKEVSVEHLAYVPLQPGIIAAGEVRDVEALTEALKGLWEANKFRTKNVHFSVGNNQVMVRAVNVDWMPEAEFRQALPYIAADYVPTNIDDVTLDYHVLKEFEVPAETEDGEPRHMRRIVLVAAANSMIANYVTAIQNAGLIPVQANLIPFSMIRASGLSGQPTSEAEALIDVGAEVTTIVIHHDGQPLWVRTLPNEGGSKITDALIAQFQWTYQDAENTKKELGLNTGLAAVAAVESVFGVDNTPVHVPAEHPAHPIINQAASTVITEVRTSIEFFLGDSSQEVTSLRRVVLTGGGSLLKGMAQRLASELRVNVEYGTPLNSVKLSKKASEAQSALSEQQWAVAVGTAMGASL